MKASSILSLGCLLIGATPLQAQERELGEWGGGNGFFGGGRDRDRDRDGYQNEDLISITCAAEFECSCNDGDATFVCREKTGSDGATKMKAKCINPARARLTDVCGCCGEECPSRNKFNSFERWEKDFYSEDDEDGESEIFDRPDPTSRPTTMPTSKPTDAPVADPTDAPVTGPSQAPSVRSSVTPTVAPFPAPTAAPSPAPFPAPTADPSPSPTIAETDAPTDPPVSRPRPIDPSPTTSSTVVVAQDDSDVPLPPDAVAITSYQGTSVTFTITQKWKTSDSVSWIAPAYDQAAGDMYCNEDDKGTSVRYNAVSTYTALCDGDTASVDLFVHDGSFSGSQANIRGCNGWGNDNKIAYYTILLSCDGTSVAAAITTTATFDALNQLPLAEEKNLPTSSPTIRGAAFGATSSVEQIAGLDEEIKMRRIYLASGAGLVVLILLAVAVKMCCFRKLRKSVR